MRSQKVQPKRKTQQGLSFDNLCLLVSWLKLPVKSVCCAVLKRAMMQYLKELTLSEPITHRYWVRLQVTAEKCWGGLGRINHGVHSLHADLPRKDGHLTRSGTSSKAEEHLKLPIRHRREMRPYLHNIKCVSYKWIVSYFIR